MPSDFDRKFLSAVRESAATRRAGLTARHGEEQFDGWTRGDAVDQVARRLGIARGLVEEAFLRLKHEGMLESRVDGGVEIFLDCHVKAPAVRVPGTEQWRLTAAGAEASFASGRPSKPKPSNA